jgi:hypothetical protein
MYANLHTRNFTGGEIRGQVRRRGSDMVEAASDLRNSGEVVAPFVRSPGESVRPLRQMIRF